MYSYETGMHKLMFKNEKESRLHFLNAKTFALTNFFSLLYGMEYTIIARHGLYDVHIQY